VEVIICQEEMAQVQQDRVLVREEVPEVAEVEDKEEWAARVQQV
jgi:hypothetical protein